MLHRFALQQAAHRFIYIGRENAVHIEAGAVRHDDGRFALLFRQHDGGGQRLLRGAGVRNHLHQRHLFHRAEVVQADNVFRPLRLRGDIRDRQR